MDETKNILQFATKRSLAILDELGRGTSTFDGYSIAHAVFNHLVKQTKCRVLFATHYHMLLDDFRGVKNVASYYMASKKSDRDDKIIFLYKFIKGECPKSFGMNVALMSGIDKKLVNKA
jgi:DNA mismatch repair protein MSH6